MNSVIRLGMLVGVGVALGACSSPAVVPPPPVPVPSSAAPAPVCPESGVKITAGEVEGASGLRALGLVLTNCGTRDYTANGYPVVRVLDANGQPLGIVVGNGSAPVSAPDSYDVVPQPGTLGPGGQVTARLLWRNTVTDPAVLAKHGEHLEIAPAAGEPAQVVTPRGGVDLGTTGRLAVNAWAARP
ncbi:DUF4232 domain-containing protein [Amycolatopsis albispora]|uniref:DUF4232 domain-containing protein n=1 Tax=Amycolatopsis albispora TaxID=1804986 RepID=A0A344L0Q2_9PSEU|nr:DUF4232 domain-containing protein [Amycolatopsis albispora]AXB41626.1 hypothetical protein A4R43_03080 [Amycolatopsis albispora]